MIRYGVVESQRYFIMELIKQKILDIKWEYLETHLQTHTNAFIANLHSTLVGFL